MADPDVYSLHRRLIGYYEERANLKKYVKDSEVVPDNWRIYCQASRLYDLEGRLIPELETHLAVFPYRVLGCLPYIH